MQKPKTSLNVQVEVRSPQDQQMVVHHRGSIATYNMATLLRFRDDLETSLSEHAATQSYWEQVAIDLKFVKLQWEDESYAKWWGHARRYGRLFHKAKGLKETLESLKDVTIQLFTDRNSPEQRDAYASACFYGHLVEKWGTTKKADEYLKEASKEEQDAFSEEMWLFWIEGWTYEEIQRVNREITAAFEKADAFARSYSERAYQMKVVADLEKAKFGNTNPRVYSEPHSSDQPWGSSVHPVTFSREEGSTPQPPKRRVMNMPRPAGT